MVDEAVLDTAGLAAKLGKSERTIQRWVSSGEITELQPAGGFLYSVVMRELLENGQAEKARRRERSQRVRQEAELMAAAS